MSDLISREWVLNKIWEREKEPNYQHESEDWSVGLIMAENIVNYAPTIELEPRWIPCSERLPGEQRKSYWACTDSGYQCECRWTNINHFWTQLTTDWHWHLMDTPQYSKVVAWMPLPKPYKTNEVEE